MSWVAAVLLLAFLGLLVCSSFTWYSGPLYRLLTWVRDNIVLVCTFVVLMGWVFISYFFVARPVAQLEALTDAAEQLARPTEERIVLPEALAEAEVQLNAAREQALRDARAAKDAEQRKNDLVVYLAHDLKTPLTSVIGYLTLLRDEPQISPELRARYTGIALDKAERLEDLINEFFDITRFNLSHIELETRPTDLVRMVQQVASEFAPQLAEARLTCRLELPEKLMSPCDPDKMARVFDNLLRNACHYSLPGLSLIHIWDCSAGWNITPGNWTWCFWTWRWGSWTAWRPPGGSGRRTAGFSWCSSPAMPTMSLTGTAWGHWDI